MYQIWRHFPGPSPGRRNLPAKTICASRNAHQAVGRLNSLRRYERAAPTVIRLNVDRLLVACYSDPVYSVSIACGVKPGALISVRGLKRRPRSARRALPPPTAANNAGPQQDPRSSRNFRLEWVAVCWRRRKHQPQRETMGQLKPRPGQHFGAATSAFAQTPRTGPNSATTQCWIVPQWRVSRQHIAAHSRATPLTWPQGQRQFVA